tara:strand:+ start:560 stop:772 length:213 start_codon:yes stop_codon:yes gene_type:complete
MTTLNSFLILLFASGYTIPDDLAWSYGPKNRPSVIRYFDIWDLNRGMSGLMVTICITQRDVEGRQLRILL